MAKLKMAITNTIEITNWILKTETTYSGISGLDTG